MRGVAASLVVVLLVAAPAPSEAQVQPEQQQREREHVVRTGDTLWDLAQQYFANPFRWRMIHDANTHSVADPHWIYPDQVLIIPGIRDVTTVAVVSPPVAPPPPRTVFYVEPPARLDPDAPTILLDAVRGRVPVMPGEFFAAPYLADPDFLAPVGRVLRPVRERQTVRGLPRSAHPSDDLYIGHRTLDHPAVGDLLMVVSVGRRVREAGRTARMIVPRAVVRVEEVSADVMRARVETQYGRTSADDLVLRYPLYPDFLAESALPLNGAPDLEGRLIAFVDDQGLYGRLSQAFIDLGEREGVQVGDVFEAFLPERLARRRRVDVYRDYVERVPEEQIAVLRVIRVEGSTATVVVDEIKATDLSQGAGVRRIRKMP